MDKTMTEYKYVAQYESGNEWKKSSELKNKTGKNTFDSIKELLNTLLKADVEYNLGATGYRIVKKPLEKEEKVLE